MAGPKEGTIYVVVRPTVPWPPPEAVVMFRQSYQGGAVELRSDTNGRLTFAVTDAGNTAITEFASEPVTIHGTGFVVFSATWNDGTCKPQINFKDLPAAGSGSAVQVFTTERPVVHEFSIDQPNAATACATWIQNRRRKFQTRPTLRRDRYKTTAEEVSDLERSIACLRDLRSSVLSGKKYQVGLLAGELRALAIWVKDDQPDRNYNPLLLRLASRADLPLPVFAISQSGPPPIAGMVFHFAPDIPRVLRTHCNETLIDLQEWLNREVLDIASGNRLLAKEVISETANSQGVSHYDEDISNLLESLQELEIFKSDGLTHFLCQASITIEELSEWVIRKLRDHGLIK